MSAPATRRPRRLARLAGIMLLDGFRAAPGWMTAVTALLVLGSVASTCYPLGYRLLVDGALAGSAPDTAGGVAVVAGLLAIGWILNAIGATEAMALSDRIALYRTSQLIGLISGVPTLEHLERPDYLTEVERLNANRRQLAAAPRQLLSNASSVARIVTLLVLLGSVSPWLLLLPVAAVPPLTADRLAKKITKRADDDMGHTRRLAGMIFELGSNAAAAGEIRSYGLSGHLAALHRRLSGEVNRRSRREAASILGIQSAGWLLYAAGLMGAIGFVVFRASAGTISVGTVLMTVSLIRRSRNQLSSAASRSGALVNTLATADRLFWLEDHAAEQAALAGTARPPDRLASGIELRGLTFRYPGTDRAVLADLNVTLAAGSTVALVGENGSGKTTLVKLLLGMYRPDAGEILVDGTPLAAIDPAGWRERCAAAFQDFARFNLPAVETVGVADLPALADEPAAAAALDRAGGADLVGQLPDGLATYVGTAYTGGVGLSGGQWQKLALGRAMRKQGPLLVVLDEPTASLDATSEHALFERYASAAHEAARDGTVTVLVSHRFSTVRMADLIIFVEEGRAVESGSHEDLLAAGGRYAELFGLQAGAYTLDQDQDLHTEEAPGSGGIVEQQAEGVAAAGTDRGHPVPDGCRRPAARGPHGPVAGGEHQAVAVRDQPRGAPRLRPRALLHQQELTPGVVLPGVAEVDHHLEREHQVAVQIPVQRVPVARAVAEQQRRRLGLARPVAPVQPLVQRPGPGSLPAQPGVPVPGDGQQVRVESLPQPFDRLRQRRGEVAVLAPAESVPGHVDGGPEPLRPVVQGREVGAFGRGQQPGQQRPAEVVQFAGHRGPVRGGHPVAEPAHRAGPGFGAGAGHAAPSRCSSAALAFSPPAYRPIEPSERITRWQGTTTGSGFVAQAVPAARTAFGLPAAAAT